MSSKPLPIYDLLVTQTNRRINNGELILSDNVLKSADGSEIKQKLAAKLESLPPDAAEQVSLLLVHLYYSSGGQGNPFRSLTKSSSKTGSGSPFKMKGNSHGKGYSFDLDQIHPNFQAVLATYCKI